MKQKFSVLDVKAIVNELKDILVNKYMVNIYSTKQKLFYIKFSSKDILVVEPGSRMHLTEKYDTEISHFCKKLREYIRNYRVIDIYQFGFDRIVVFDLLKYKLILEFYSLGNVVLIDNEDTIVDIHRPLEQFNMTKGKKYPWNLVKFDLDTKIFALEKSEFISNLPFEKDFGQMVLSEFEDKKGIKYEQIKENDGCNEFIKFTMDKIDNLGWSGEVCFKKDKAESFTSFISNSTKALALNTLDSKPVKLEEGTDKNKIKFTLPDLMKISEQYKSSKMNILTTNCFNHAAYIYFEMNKKAGKKDTILSKEEKIQKAQQRYITELEKQESCLQETVDVVECNREIFGKVLVIFDKVYKNKMSWDSFDHFYTSEKQKGNPLADVIESYNLKKKTAIVKCEEEHIELDLEKTVDQNINSIYKKKKKLLDKQVKTGMAMKNIQEKLKPKRETVKTQTRVLYWFEKFHFFISEKNTLIIGGRNAQQNELVVSKYMDNTDLYFHCDVKGASSVICKGSSETNIVDAMYMALSMSKSWEEQVMKDVFYVNAEQVSKTAPSGEYVAKGSFVIKGKKQMVHPHRLEYGIAFIFKLKDDKELLSFVNNPDENAEIEHAMPISGPWVTLKKYKYAERLVPGQDRKQKIAQAITNKFDKDSINTNHNSYIRAVGLQEIISILPGKCRIAKK